MVLSMKNDSHVHESSLPPRMSVNVALCGGIPRSNFRAPLSVPCCAQILTSRLSNGAAIAIDRYGNDSPTHPKKQETPSLAAQNKLAINQQRHSQGTMRTVLGERQPLTHLHEAPTWAVPAKGETRLEPVCEGLGRQVSIDLTMKSAFRVGRSPHSDVQLMHATSSRRHAMLFHHANGSCYLVDCGSAHGTYVNGVRISSPGNGGVVIPHKVRRGAMIRFGGPGAPCFILKSFSFRLRDVAGDDQVELDSGELVRRNTRINALGTTAANSVRDSLNLKLHDPMLVSRKRSFDSLSTSDTLDEDFEPASQRRRCSSPPLSPEHPMRLVSPDLPSILISKRRRVCFSTEPPDVCYPVPYGGQGEPTCGE